MKLLILRRERVDLEHEALDPTLVVEVELEAQRLGVVAAVAAIVDRHAVGDRGVERGVTREQPGAARGDRDRAAEPERPADRDAEVLDDDADVVELEDAADPDLRRSSTRSSSWRPAAAATSPRWPRSTSVRRQRGAAVAQLEHTEVEAVAADPQTGDLVAGVPVGPASGRTCQDAAAQRDLLELDHGLVDAHQLLVRVEVGRVVADLDALGGDGDDVGHDDLERLHVEGSTCPAARRGTLPDSRPNTSIAEVERAEHAEQVDLHAAVRLGAGPGPVPPPLAELEAGQVDTDGDREHDHAVLEPEVGEADRRALQRQRAEVDRAVGGGLAGLAGVDRERLAALHVEAAVDGARSCRRGT